MFKNLIQLIMMISFNLFRFYNGLFYINNKNNLIFFLFYPVVFVLIFLVSIFVDKSFHLNHFKEKVVLILNNKKYQVEAYFDSGNVLLYNRIPVIFMVENKCPIDKKDFNIEIFTKTINGNKIYFAKEVMILVNGKKEYKYSYLCLVNKESFNGCELLLNAYLF